MIGPGEVQLTSPARRSRVPAVADQDSPEYGTLVTAALLILALAFAGYWIYTYVGDTGQPLTPWFGVAAVIIVLVAIANFVFTRRSSPRGGP